MYMMSIHLVKYLGTVAWLTLNLYARSWSPRLRHSFIRTSRNCWKLDRAVFFTGTWTFPTWIVPSKQRSEEGLCSTSLWHCLHPMIAHLRCSVWWCCSAHSIHCTLWSSFLIHSLLQHNLQQLSISLRLRPRYCTEPVAICSPALTRHILFPPLSHQPMSTL